MNQAFKECLKHKKIIPNAYYAVFHAARALLYSRGRGSHLTVKKVRFLPEY
jgi:uncharacterized protein (UPF0332 family)